MATLALPSAARLLSSTGGLRPLVARTFLSATLALPPFATPKPFAWALPTLQSLLEFFPPFLLAVPKKKVSHSRKSMRSANKGLKDKHNLVHCPGCGAPKLAHHLCASCYSEVSRRWKREARAPEPSV